MKKALLTILILFTLTNVKAQKNDTTKESPIFTSVEQMPEFPGGPAAFINFLSNNLQYPVKAVTEKVQGKVFISFFVEKDGSLSEVKILRSLSAEIDSEAVRVIKKSPKWKPGIQNGRAVRTSFTLPINFKLPSFVQTDSLKIFTAVEHMPSFPGGWEKFNQYLQDSLRYPAEPRRNKLQGKVMIDFIVERDGSLSNFRIISSPSTDFSNEAIRLLKDSPKWTPGIQNGNSARVLNTAVVYFRFKTEDQQ